MRSRREHVLAFVIACGLALHGLPAAAQSYVVRTYTGADGLPSDHVKDVVQGPDRRLWIATRSGLAVFDGSYFQTVPLPELAQPDLGLLEVVHDGTIAAISQFMPFDLYLSGDGTDWTRIEGPRDERSWSNVQVTGLADLEIGGGHHFAVTTETEGLFIRNGDRWHAVPPDRFGNGRLFDVEAFDGHFYIASSSGMFRSDADGMIEPLGGSLTSKAPGVFALLATRPATSAGDPASERLWILGEDWLGYLENERLHTVTDEIRLPRITGTVSLKGCIAIDSLGGIYFGLSSGLFYLDSRSGEISPIGTANGLATDGVNSFAFDDEQNLWIGSARGLGKISSRRFETYRQAHGLLEDEVSAIAEIEQGTILFGHNRGLTFFDGNAFRTVDFSREGMPAGGTRIMEIEKDPDGSFWLAGVESGLGHLHRDGTVSWMSGTDGLPPIVISVRATADALYVVGGEGLFRRSRGEQSFRRIEIGSWIGLTRRVELADDGTIFLMGAEGLAFGREGKWQLADTPDNRLVSSVYSVLPDGPDGRVWVGTLAGLYALDGHRLGRVRLGSAQIDQPVYFMLRETPERTWIGTNDGAFLWDGVTLRHFTVRQGLAGRETNRGAAIVDHTGAVWIGTDRGVSKYDRRFDDAVERAPTPVLLTVDAGEHALPLSKPATFANEEDDLSFRFRAVSFSDEQVLHRYFLEGLDDDWSDPVSLPDLRVDFRNLRPGRYRFHLMSGFKEGPWSSVVSSPTIRILRPFWQTGWFAAITAALAAVAALLIFAVLRARHRQAHFDGLTQLPNRESFFRQLEHEFEATRGTSQQFAVLLLDLDHFRFVTNSLGHGAGDKLLVLIADRLRQAVRHPHFVSRLGSDEFAVLLRGVDGVESVKRIAGDVRKALSRHFELDGQEIFSSASIGVTVGPGEYRWASNLLRDADTAMHGAKARGLGGIEVFDRTMHSRALGLLRLESDLRRAIERGEFRLHYQPIVSMETLDVVSVEALLRWQHPVAGFVGPDEFLQVAEETGLILEIGDWVLDTACAQLKAWKSGMFRNRSLTMHVNISPRQFEDPQLAGRIASILDAHGLAPTDLVLEITEASVVGKSATSVGLLRDLEALGVPLCIDDFGAGHSSLSYVRDLPVQCLKLDRSFISHGILRQWREIIDTILSLARSLALPVIAEGIETEDDFEQLRSAGCQAGQGYYFSRAVAEALIRPRIEIGVDSDDGSNARG